MLTLITRYRLLAAIAVLALLLLSGAMAMATFVIQDLPLLGKIVVIDPGHGGIDPGANNPQIAEKHINLAMALRVKEILTRRGAVIVLTRDTDRELSTECDNPHISGRHRRDLHARLEAIIEHNAHLGLSIHANASSDPREHGHDTYYYPGSPDSQLLAAAINQELSIVTGTNRLPKKGTFYLLRASKAPCVLVEVGFITNPRERELLQDEAYQEQLALALAAAVEKFLLRQIAPSPADGDEPLVDVKSAGKLI